jgi:hypothetical protein
MKRKKTYIVISLLVISILVLLGLLVSFVTDYYRPFKIKQPPEKKKTTKKVLRKKKVPLSLVKEIMSQQRESSYNLRQLAMGGIKSISINGIVEKTDEVDLQITATYADNSEVNGAATFWKRDGDWYLVEVTRESRYPDQPTGTHVSELTKSDIEIGKEIAAQQQQDQKVAEDFVAGRIKNLQVSKVINEIDSEGRDRSAVRISTTYEDGRDIQIVARMVHHEGFWYLTRIERR